MSDSSDEEVQVRRPKVSQNNRKRQRLLSEDSNGQHEGSNGRQSNDLDKNQLSDDDSDKEISLKSKIAPSSDEESKDEIIAVPQAKEPAKKHKQSSDVVVLNELDDDSDDDNDSDGNREDDEIVEELYADEDDYESRPKSSAAQKRIATLREQVCDFFQNASAVDLESIPGVSKKKVEQLLALRPITGWDDLNKKIQNHKSAGINEDVVINAVKTLKSRTVVEKLMNDCQKLAQDIEHLVERLPEAPQPKSIPAGMNLAPYQLIGLNWLNLMHNRGINAILADEMGLGKTIQIIAFLALLRERYNLRNHHLIIVPASTLDNWEREIENWNPEIRVLQYYGPQLLRAQIRHFMSHSAHEVDVILTTYNVAQNPEDRKLFKKIGFEYLIFDEAHMLKNMKSSRYQSLIKIRSKRRILLTGTPVQNNLVELMSLLVFTMPRMFMSKMSHVEALFSAASREEGGRTQFERERIEQAKKIMRPFVLRRLKDDVLKSLPKKIEETICCDMSAKQAKLYSKIDQSFKRETKNEADATLSDYCALGEEFGDEVKKGSGMLMAMRKIANHPLLVLNHYTKDKLRKMAALMLQEPSHREANKDLIFEDMSVMHDYELHQLCKTYKSIEKFKLSDDVILDSGKMRQIDGLLEDLAKRNQRCLIFSQFTMMLDILEEYLNIRNRRYIRLDGSTKVEERISLIDAFNEDESILIFLLSTKAGGLGINLTAANVVIIHDIDFNPYNDKQAEDRIHRMGQTKDVTIYKLISKNTVEEHMLNIATEKLRLGKNMSELKANGIKSCDK